MIQSIVEHIKKRIVEYMIPFVLATVWFMFNLYTDIRLMKCKLGMREGISICQIVTTLAEDIAKETGETD